MRTTGVMVTAVVAASFALYFGRELLVPIAFAILLNALFRPIVHGLEKLGLKAPYGATIVVVGLVIALIVLIWLLASPVKKWLDEVPQHVEVAERKLHTLRVRFAQVTNVAERIAKAANGATTAPAPAHAPQVPAGAVARVMGTTQQFVSAVVEVILLLLLLLASGDLFFRKLIRVIPAWRDKRRAEQVVDESQRAVMRYIVVTAMINAGQALVVGVTLWLLKMPSPILWALLTFVLEFIPYLGATIMIALLSVMAFAAFDNLGHILLVPGSYLVITTIQNNVVSPVLYGSHLKLNPVAVLVGVLLWWFLWGIPGAFLAVPLVATIKIVADRVEPLKPVGEFLGE